jgi:hypothetical protein
MKRERRNEVRKGEERVKRSKKREESKARRR